MYYASYASIQVDFIFHCDISFSRCAENNAFRSWIHVEYVRVLDLRNVNPPVYVFQIRLATRLHRKEARRDGLEK